MNKHFLVVDDSGLNLRVVKNLLDKYGITAQYVTSAEKAFTFLENCREKPFDLILMDYLMPGMNGIEAAQHIRNMKGDMSDEYYRTTPIIALTAEESRQLLEKMLSVGINDILFKPIQNAAFKDMLDKWSPSISGIDESVFKRMMEADSKVFMELAGFFCADTEGKIERIGKALEAGDYEAYTVDVHKIKGEAKLIGANGLADSAKYLEFIGKAVTGVIPNGHPDEENKSVIAEKTPDLLRRLQETTDALNRIISEKSGNDAKAEAAPEETKEEQISSDAPDEQTTKQLDKLARYIEHAREALSEQKYQLAQEWLGEMKEIVEGLKGNK